MYLQNHAFFIQCTPRRRGVHVVIARKALPNESLPECLIFHERRIVVDRTSTYLGRSAGVCVPPHARCSTATYGIIPIHPSIVTLEEANTLKGYWINVESVIVGSTWNPRCSWINLVVWISCARGGSLKAWCWHAKVIVKKRVMNGVVINVVIYLTVWITIWSCMREWSNHSVKWQIR